MKAETKHTPGPWNVGRTITGSGPNLVARGVNGDGKMVYDAMIEAPAYFVAGVGGIGKEECLANASLIAAAPEMLQALEEISTRAPLSDYASTSALHLRLVATQSIARAAIAKAKGNQ